MGCKLGICMKLHRCIRMEPQVSLSTGYCRIAEAASEAKCGKGTPPILLPLPFRCGLPVFSFAFEVIRVSLPFLTTQQIHPLVCLLTQSSADLFALAMLSSKYKHLLPVAFSRESRLIDATSAPMLAVSRDRRVHLLVFLLSKPATDWVETHQSSASSLLPCLQVAGSVE
jgi:hypothetical protein